MPTEGRGPVRTVVSVASRPVLTAHRFAALFPCVIPPWLCCSAHVDLFQTYLAFNLRSRYLSGHCASRHNVIVTNLPCPPPPPAPPPVHSRRFALLPLLLANVNVNGIALPLLFCLPATCCHRSAYHWASTTSHLSVLFCTSDLSNIYSR